MIRDRARERGKKPELKTLSSFRGIPTSAWELNDSQLLEKYNPPRKEKNNGLGAIPWVVLLLGSSFFGWARA